MKKADTRELKNGFGDAFAAAFELTVTPAIFGLIGWFVDRQLGTTPLLTIIFVLVTVGYASWKMYREYSETLEKKAAERREIWQSNGPLA